MRYVTNWNGQVVTVAFGGDVECAWGDCTEYTGGVPTGYISLEDWYADEGEKLYRWKIVNGQLTLDTGATPPDKDVPFAPADHYHYSLALGNCSNTDFNTLKTHGIYFGHTGMTNAAVQNICVLEVIPYSPDWVVQRQTAILSTGANITYERVFHSGSTWSAWGCVNPPMEIGVEYRTTERYNGKVVYAKLLDLGHLPANTEKAYSGVLSTADFIISMDAYAVGDQTGLGVFSFATIPLFGFNGVDYIYYNRGAGGFNIKTNMTFSNISHVYVLAKYYK